MRLLCALGLFLALLHVTSCLLIGAFNIKDFGKTKSSNKDVMEIIKKIVLRYDIILIQEVHDTDGTVTRDLMTLVNGGIVEGAPDHFKNISSDPLPLPLGGTNKERYLFLYKNEKVTVKSSFQYNAGKEGVFRRPPFIVKFSSTLTAVDFVLIPIHTSPLSTAEAEEKKKKSTVEQLEALVDVVDAAGKRWTNNNIMVLGDFNADGTYVNKAEWNDILLLFNNTGLHSLIANGVDTTVTTKSSNTYDRIVVTTEMNKGVVNNTAGVFDFREAYHIDQDLAEAVSDHFPVQVGLKLRLWPKPKAVYKFGEKRQRE